MVFFFPCCAGFLFPPILSSGGDLLDTDPSCRRPWQRRRRFLLCRRPPRRQYRSGWRDWRTLPLALDRPAADPALILADPPPALMRPAAGVWGRARRWLSALAFV